MYDDIVFCVLRHVSDGETFRACRLVCRQWRQMARDIEAAVAPVLNVVWRTRNKVRLPYREAVDVIAGGVRHGTYVMLTPEERTYRIGVYHYGHLYGWQVTYRDWITSSATHDNDTIITIEPIVNDVVVGRAYGFLENSGHMIEEFDLVNNDLTGVYVSYRINGTIRSKETFTKGVLHGPSIQYHRLGTVKRVSHFEHGRLHGPQCVYGPRQRLVSVVEYDRDDIHGYSVYYNSDGQAMMATLYERGTVKRKFHDTEQTRKLRRRTTSPYRVPADIVEGADAQRRHVSPPPDTSVAPRLDPSTLSLLWHRSSVVP
jgi:antitoxin component YwqK of YwqJK toxin-antitoxin module